MFGEGRGGSCGSGAGDAGAAGSAGGVDGVVGGDIVSSTFSNSSGDKADRFVLKREGGVGVRPACVPQNTYYTCYPNPITPKHTQNQLPEARANWRE